MTTTTNGAGTRSLARMHIWTTLEGKWGWSCGYCRAEARYVYVERATAERLARRHAARCSHE